MTRSATNDDPPVDPAHAPAGAPLRVALLTNVIPSYRVPFYRRLVERVELDLTIYCQRELPGLDLDLAELDDALRARVTWVPYRHWRLGDLFFQKLPGRELQDHDVFVIMGNPRYLSNVWWSLRLRAQGRPTVAWGHALPGSELSGGERIRLAWWRGFDAVLAYTDDGAANLHAHGFDPARTLGMNNGLDQGRIAAAAGAWDDTRLADWRRDRGLADGPLLLSCARLVDKNRFDLVIPALASLSREIPDLRWVVIGDGPLRSSLEDQAGRAGVAERVIFTGALYDEDALAPWFRAASVFVHPGSIGLSLLHAFGYGLPVVTHDDRTAHTPEIAALRPDESGVVYHKDSAEALADAIRRLASDPALRSRIGAEARRLAEEEYNVDVMADRFVEACRRAAGR